MVDICDVIFGKTKSSEIVNWCDDFIHGILVECGEYTIANASKY